MGPLPQHRACHLADALARPPNARKTYSAALHRRSSTWCENINSQAHSSTVVGDEAERCIEITRAG
eukprot:7065590-Pyramimonas_sp.AAC.1